MRRSTPSARARRLTTQRSVYIDSIGWTRDGSAVVYSAAVTPQTSYLWRVGVDGTRPPARIEVAGASAYCASHRAVARPAGVHTDVVWMPTSTASTWGVLRSWSLGPPLKRWSRVGPRMAVASCSGRRRSGGDSSTSGSPTPTDQTRNGSRTGPSHGFALVVTRRAPHRIRLVRRWAFSHLDDGCRRRNPASAHHAGRR